MIKVLVAENSEAERAKLVDLLRKDAQIQVIGVATCGAEAVSMTRRLRPQVVAMGALDRSPRLTTHVDNLQATRMIMAQAPTPIVVALSGTAASGERSGEDLLAAGAVAVLRRGAAGREASSERELVETLKAMSSVKVVGHRLRTRPPPAPLPGVGSHFGIVAIAASTGGPHALTQVLRPLPRDLPVPVVIVQHLAAGFVKGFTHWLDQHCAMPVKLVERAEHLRPGTAYVAADGAHLRVLKHAQQDARRQRGDLPYLLMPSLGPAEDGFCPSASVLFESVAEAFGRSALAVILTGMGRDGVSGLAKVRARGGKIIAQDQETSVVFGMPSVAIEAGLADFVLPIDKMARQILDLVCAKEPQ